MPHSVLFSQSASAKYLTHFPPTQSSPALHVASQLPQLSGSTCFRLAGKHVPLPQASAPDVVHSVSVRQNPFTQNIPPAHGFPQPPQFSWSKEVSTQPPLQFVSPGRHTQPFRLHVCA